MSGRLDAVARQILELPVGHDPMGHETWSELEARFGGPVHPAIRRVLSDVDFSDRLPFQWWQVRRWCPLHEAVGAGIDQPPVEGDFVVVGEAYTTGERPMTTKGGSYTHSERSHDATGELWGFVWSTLATTSATLSSWSPDRGVRTQARPLLDHPKIAAVITKKWLAKRRR